MYLTAPVPSIQTGRSFLFYFELSNKIQKCYNCYNNYRNYKRTGQPWEPEPDQELVQRARASYLIAPVLFTQRDKVQESYTCYNKYRNYKRTGQAGEAKADQRLMQRAGVWYPSALLSRHAAFEEQIAAETRLRAPGAVCRPEMFFWEEGHALIPLRPRGDELARRACNSCNCCNDCNFFQSCCWI